MDRDPSLDCDAVVIGSGMGGLTTAALLARLHGWKVIVLERHWRAGGFTHAFSRPGGYRWDVGVHYVGEVEKPGMFADLLRVVTDGGLAWRRMADPFERLVFPGFEVALRGGRFREDLAGAFPSEGATVDRFLRDVGRATSYLGVLGMRGRARRRRLALGTTGAWLDAHVRDPRLRAVLGARWGDYGLPPSRSAFLAHATITSHYLGGGSYPVGGAGRIAEAAAGVVASAGGAVRVRAEVERILVERGRAVGVRLASGETLRARLVVSDAGARNTYLKLLPPEVPLPFRGELAATPPGMACVTLYLGLSRSPEALGVRGENFWIHDTLDQDALWARRGGVPAGEVPQVYLSFPSMKDPAARAHTAEVITTVDAADFAGFAGTPWKRRGVEYDRLKDRIADALLAAVERRLPGFSKLVAYREVSTPLTSEACTARSTASRSRRSASHGPTCGRGRWCPACSSPAPTP
jgi:all-trans-retinol 13,14-reductase